MMHSYIGRGQSNVITYISRGRQLYNIFLLEENVLYGEYRHSTNLGGMHLIGVNAGWWKDSNPLRVRIVITVDRFMMQPKA